MTLDEICQEQFYRCFRLPPPDHSGIPDEDATDASMEFERSVRRYRRFRDEAQTRLRALDPDAGTAFLYGTLPSLLQSAVATCNLGETAHSDTVRQAITDFLGGYRESYNPLSLHDVAFKVLERGLFRSVPAAHPSLDLGVGNGYVSNYIFGDRMPTVGSDPTMAPLQFHSQYRRFPHSACIDACRIPFEGDTFASVYMVHSIDHVRDRGDVLAEMHRVLRPGGVAVFSDLSDSAPGLMPMGALCKAIGLDELSADPTRFFMDMAGASREFWSVGRYRQALSSLGFEDVRIRYFCSPRLARLCWTWFEMFLAVSDGWTSFEAIRASRNSRLRTCFFDFVTSSLTPLLARDSELCEAAGQGFNLFITARKAGSFNHSGPEPVFDFPGRLICPYCKGKVVTGTGSVRCGRCGLDYPVIESVPLMMPAYAKAYGAIRDQLGRQPWRRWIPGLRSRLQDHPRLHRALIAIRRAVGSLVPHL